MRRGHKAALLGGLAVGAGVTVRRWWLIRMPLKEFTRYALYMAVLDATTSAYVKVQLK